MGLLKKRGRKPKTENKVKTDVIEQKEVSNEREITLRNDFHKTEIEITVIDNMLTFSKKEVELVKDQLYGKGCRFCGDRLGARGHQDVIYNLTDLKDGGLQITIVE